MTDFNFEQSLMLVIVPVIIGSIATGILSRDWQNYKLKIKLKQEIMESFQNSIKLALVKQDALTRKISRPYSSVEEEISQITGDILPTIDKFPAEEKDQPAKMFMADYDKYRDEFEGIRHQADILISKMRLYFEDSRSLELDLIEIRAYSGFVTQSIRYILDAKNGKELDERLRQCHMSMVENKNLIDKFEKKLVDKKIRKIPV
ncbi:MAG: hypothetical protein KGI28_00565 [Thaumarchaeota archaeon]|nr:hypothetical protein [Nitrososphaerota archaeon]